MTEIVLICFAVFIFNVWGISRGWKAEFGYVTRADMTAIVLISLVLPSGFFIALGSLASENLKTRWSDFWNKDFM